MEEKNNKRKIVILISAVIALLVLLIGITYAYFSARSVSSEQTITTANIGVTFDDSTAIINADRIYPLTDEEVFTTNIDNTQATKKSFSVTNNGSITTYVDIKMTNIIANEFKVYDLKWALLEGTTKISTGNFASIDSNENNITLTTNIELLTGESNKKSYTLLVWLHENDQNQSELMNKSITFNIEVEANQTKSKTLASQILGDNNANVLSGTYNYKADFSCDEAETCTANYTSGLYEQTGDSQKTNYGFSTYYYRGDVDNNYVKFGTYKNNVTNRVYNSETSKFETIQASLAGDNILWRVVRINEDGSIKLIAENNIGTEGNLYHMWNSLGYDEENEEYTPSIKYINDDGTNSTIKSILESWYKDDIIINTNLIQNGDYCNDISGYQDKCDSLSCMFLDAYYRLYENHTPTYKCSNEAIVANEKVGLLTGDELIYGGGLFGAGQTIVTNNVTYLNNNTYFWTSTPSSNFTVIRWNRNKISDNNAANTINTAARPVITIKADTTITGGNGSLSTPWVIE